MKIGERGIEKEELQNTGTRERFFGSSFSVLRLSSLCFLCLGGSFLFFYRLADRDLWSSHEARAAQDAQTILSDGDWVVPHLLDHRPELQKPPLYYWLVTLMAQVGGQVDAWTVRLPAALSALITILSLYFFGILRGRLLLGLAGALILATANHFTWLARVGRIDMPLTLTVGIALLAYYQGSQQGKRGWFLLSYLALALGLLLKGPIGLVLPMAVIVAHQIVERKLANRCRLRRSATPQAAFRTLWWGIPLVLLLAAPWYFWANQRTGGEFFRVFFWHHNVERGFGGADDLAAHPWWFYGPRLALDLLPWTPLLGLALWWFGKRGRWRGDPEVRFGMVWLVVVVALLSGMRFKRADYLLPAYPAAALILGGAVERWYLTARHRRALAAGFAAVVAGCVVGWLVYLDRFLPEKEPALDFRPFAEEIRRRAPAPHPIIFFRAEEHALAFHVGHPLDTVLEWENLEWWATRSEVVYVVMPPKCVGEWRANLKSGSLEEVLRSADVMPGQEPRHQQVLLRTRPVGMGTRKCGRDYFCAAAHLSICSTSAQSCCQACRSASGNFARAFASRTPLSLPSSRQYCTAWRKVFRSAASPRFCTAAQASSSARSHSRTCSRERRRPASSSLSAPTPCRLAAMAAVAAAK
jgi:4-amino-4-deoxy-L-arabinose transferase-like glycosyltransferase